MSEFKSKTGKVVKNVVEQWAGWSGRDRRDTQHRPAVDTVGGTYDELDERLMATFPASDAVAQY